MTESDSEEAYSTTSNDLLLLFTTQRLQNGFTYGTITQTAVEVQDVHNSPAISIGPYLDTLGQSELFRYISVYSERGKSREQVRLLYMNTAALGVWSAMGNDTRIIGERKRPPRTAQLMYGIPFSE